MLIAVKILVAGVGNILRGDDGFGVVAAHRLLARALPSEVRVIEVGIGGIHLVQELLDSTDALIVLDAVDSGKTPGTLLVIRPEVLDVTKLPLDQRHDQLADMHWSSPERAFILARGLGVLPPTTWVIGCQPADTDVLGEGLSPKVSDAVEIAIQELQSLVRDLGVAWE
jgi:hydrogenase maturation protease